MKKLLFPILLLAVFCHPAVAQRYFGVSTGNWSPTNSLYLNPASIADCREKFVIDLFSLNAGVDNNLGQINTSGIGKFINGNNTNVNDVFTYSNRNTFSLMAPYLEVRGPGFLYSINRKHSLAFTTRLRGINQFNNFDKTLYRTITDSSYTANGNVNLNAQNFNWTAHLWAEAALTYGAVVFEKGRSELRAGVTVRYLGGIGYLGLKGRNMDLQFNSGSGTLHASNTDLEYSSNILSTNSALSNGLSNNNLFNQFFGSKAGSGVGADFGLMYDYLEAGASADNYDMDGKTNIPNPTKNRYKLRLSASVTDLGFINYNKDNNSTVNVTGNGTLNASDIANNVKSFNDFTAYARAHGFGADTSRAATKLYMPATMLLSADYHAWRKIYVNATYVINMVNRQNYGNSFYDQVTITPRYDTRIFSFAVPVTYGMLANNMKMGLGVRALGFFIGSDDLLVLFNNKQYGVNLYAGASIQFNKHRPKDRDGDHVSDRRDRCPDEYGTWERRGCPERNTDSTDRDDEEKAKPVDTANNCPETHGLEQQQDRRDTDGDGVPDDEDACPTVAGVASNHGCPEAHPVTKKNENLRTAVIPWSRKKTTFDEEETKELNRFAGLLKEYPKGKLIIEGHTARKSNDASDVKASERYADVVRNYMVNRGGIAPGRITVKGLGGKEPAADSNGRSAKLNRRVVIRMEQ